MLRINFPTITIWFSYGMNPLAKATPVIRAWRFGPGPKGTGGLAETVISPTVYSGKLLIGNHSPDHRENVPPQTNSHHIPSNSSRPPPLQPIPRWRISSRDCNSRP